jgi:hypothetical protein
LLISVTSFIHSISRCEGCRRTQARYGIAWGAIGAAIACYEEALAYARERVAFGRPIAATQLIQERLVDMLTEITKAQLLAYHIGRLKDGGTLEYTQVSLAKRNNVRAALNIAREARSILGGYGITLRVPRYAPCGESGNHGYVRGDVRRAHAHSRPGHHRVRRVRRGRPGGAQGYRGTPMMDDARWSASAQRIRTRFGKHEARARKPRWRNDMPGIVPWNFN